MYLVKALSRDKGSGRYTMYLRFSPKESVGRKGQIQCVSTIGGVPTTPDPNTSAKVSRYKWEAYRDTNWWCIYYCLPTGVHTFAKVSR